MFQENRPFHQFELRTSVDPASVSDTLRRMVRDVLKTVPVTRVTTLADQVDSNIVPERLIATLSEFFGAYDLLVNVIPPSVDLEKIVYKQEAKSVRVTDGADWHLDLSEFTWR